MSKLQLASIITSTITIIRTLVDFVTNDRREYFVSRRYPSLASLFPYCLFFLSGICAAMFANKIELGQEVSKIFQNFKINYSSQEFSQYHSSFEQPILISSCVLLVFNWLNFLVSVLIVWVQVRPSRYWAITRSIKTLCSCGALVSVCIAFSVFARKCARLPEDGSYGTCFHDFIESNINTYFYLYCFCWLVNFVLGIIMTRSIRALLG